jgi:hypothetical protein
MPVINGTTYHEATHPRVVQWLETSRERRQPVRLFYGEPGTGRNWHSEHDVCGIVSRSMGPVKIPIMLSRRNSSGGSGILDHCVMGIITRDSNGNPKWVYRHPLLNLGEWGMQRIDGESEFPYGVFLLSDDGEDELRARFRSEAAAIRYIRYMSGRRMRA